MRIRLSALDTLFFKDGKPFERGEESWADGIFPPPPSVFYGALRSLYFIQHPEYIGKENTKEDPTRNLVINDIQITSEDNLYFPCPLDVVLKKNTLNSKENYILLNLKENKAISSSNLKYRLVEVNNQEVEPIEGYIGKRSLEKHYLNGKLPSSINPRDNFLTLEPKVGIGRDNFSHVSDEGLLYRVGMLRPKGKQENNVINIELEFQLEGWQMDIGDIGFIKTGGESKSCSYEVIEEREKYTLSNISNDIIKFYFVTPTVFKNNHHNNSGWLPAFFDENYEGEWNGIKLKFLAACTGKSKALGGFDIQKRRPKSMVKMIPEGAVYYFKILNNSDKEQLKKIKQPIKLIDDLNDSKSETSIGRDKQGFGLAYISNVI